MVPNHIGQRHPSEMFLLIQISVLVVVPESDHAAAFFARKLYIPELTRFYSPTCGCSYRALHVKQGRTAPISLRVKDGVSQGTEFSDVYSLSAMDIVTHSETYNIWFSARISGLNIDVSDMANLSFLQTIQWPCRYED